MNYLPLVLLLLASSANAGEFTLLHGKGVKHNPDADNLAVTFRTDTPWPHVYTEYGASSTNTALPREFGRSYVSVHLAKQIEYSYRGFYANIALGTALAQRTSDNAEYALAPYGAAFIGWRHKGISVGFGEWMLYRPKLTYKWEAGHAQAYHAEGERWNSPAFLGLRIGVDLDVRRP